MKRKYEVLLLLDPTLAKEDLIKLIEKIEAKLGGTIVKKEEWGIKKLAYTIKKMKEAYYLLYYVETESTNIADLRGLIAVDKKILRPMILVHERKWPFEYKTGKDLKFPVRKPRRTFNNDKRPSNRPATNDDTATKPVVKKEAGENNDK